MTVKENEGVFEVDLCRRGVKNSNSTIKLTIVGDSNSNPAISSITKNVTFLPNQEKITEKVTVTDDQFGENETSSFLVTIGLSYDPVVKFINQTTLNVTLLDNDIVFYFPGSRVKTVNEDVGTLNVTIEREGVISAQANVTINFTSNADCTGQSNPTITFEANVVTKNVTLCTVVDDKLVEPEEMFTIELGGAGGSIVKNSENNMTLKITSNDVNITCSKATVKEHLGTVDMGMARSGAINTDNNTIRCFTKPDSAHAINRSDYTSKDKKITFKSGITSSKLSINITEDRKVERNETLTVSCNTTDDRVNLISCTDVPITIINDDTYIFFCSPYKTYIRENDGPYTVELCLVGVMAVSHKVKLCWTSDANGLLHDYPSITEQCTDINFEPYQQRKKYNITIKKDTWGEEEFRKFNISIQNIDASVTFNDTTSYLVTLHDEDNSFCTTKPLVFYEQTDQYVNITIKRFGAITTTNASVRVKIQQNNKPNRAIPPKDYESLDEKVFTFLVNETEKTVTVKINDDKTTEDNETFNFLLFGVNNESTVFPQCRDSPVTIVSNDVSIFCNDLNIGTQSIFENEGPVTITFVREGSLQYTHTIRVKTVAGTAKPGIDFKPFNNLLTFKPNQTQIQQNITLVNDLIVEADETFSIDVSSTDGRVNRLCIGIDYVIKNDDTFIRCANSSISVNEGTKTVHFVIKREGYLGKMARVWYKTVDGSAYDKADYKPVNKTYFDFSAGQVYTTLSVDIVNDDVREETENFAITIGSDDPTIVTSSSCTTVKIKDDDEKLISEKQAQDIEKQRQNAIILLALAVGILVILTIGVAIFICVVCRAIM